MSQTKAVTRAPYTVASVEKSEPPGGDIEGRDWYCYVVVSGRSTITGYCRGSRQDATCRAQDFAEDLNSRMGGVKPFGWTPRKSAGAPQRPR